MVYLVLFWLSEMCRYTFSCMLPRTISPFLSEISKQAKGKLFLWEGVYYTLVFLVLVQNIVQISIVIVGLSFYILPDLPILILVHTGST